MHFACLSAYINFNSCLNSVKDIQFECLSCLKSYHSILCWLQQQNNTFIYSWPDTWRHLNTDPAADQPHHSPANYPVTVNDITCLNCYYSYTSDAMQQSLSTKTRYMALNPVYPGQPAPNMYLNQPLRILAVTEASSSPFRDNTDSRTHPLFNTRTIINICT